MSLLKPLGSIRVDRSAFVPEKSVWRDPFDENHYLLGLEVWDKLQETLLAESKKKVEWDVVPEEVT